MFYENRFSQWQVPVDQIELSTAPLQSRETYQPEVLVSQAVRTNS